LSKIIESEDIYKLLKHKGALSNEQVILGVVSKKRDLIGYHTVGSGSNVESVIDMDAVNKLVINSPINASIFLVHNHPNEDCIPSKDDDLVTERIMEICRILSRAFIDHLIIGQDEYFSYKNEVRTKYVSRDN